MSNTSESLNELEVSVTRNDLPRDADSTWVATAFEVLPGGKTGDVRGSGEGNTRAAALADLASDLTDDE